MQKILKILLATAFLLGMASTIAASANPASHGDMMWDGDSQLAYSVDTSPRLR